MRREGLAPPRRLVTLRGKAQGRHRVVVGARSESPVAIMGVLAHTQLVVEQLLGQHPGFPSLRQVDPTALEQPLEPRHHEGLVEAFLPPVLPSSGLDRRGRGRSRRYRGR
jgi:hypothetical protein